MITAFENSNANKAAATATKQFATFYVGDRLCGIEVTQVQEIAKPLALTPVRRAPPYVAGLINLRGQIATAIDLREVFGIKPDGNAERMSVVCRFEGSLLSLLVDQIGDVMELANNSFEPIPETIQGSTRRFVRGVYKTPDALLSVLELNQLVQHFSK